MTSQLVRLKKRIEKTKKNAHTFLAKKHFFFHFKQEKKRLNSSTVKMSSSFEQKPNFTHQNGHCA